MNALRLALSFSLLSASAHGQDLDATLAAAREALGWNALGAQQAVRVVGAARLLGTDAVQTILFDGAGDFVQTFDGPLAQENGIARGDGVDAVHWTRDWTGTPRRLVLGDLANAEVGALLLSGGWASAGDRLVFDAAAEAPGTVTLTFHHADGVMRGDVELDAATHLPRVVHFGFDETASTWTFSGWRAHDGWPFPDRIELSSSGMTQDLRVHTVERLASAPAAAFTPRLDRPDDVRFDPEAAPELDVKRAPGGYLLVRPTVEGEDLGWFILDSGAGTNCIAASVARALAEGPFGQIPARGIGGTVPASFWKADELVLGPMTVAGPIFMELDLAFLDAAFGVKIGGILGFELFARCVAEVDMAEGVVALFDPRDYALPDDGRWEDALLYGRHPNVRATFEGHEGIFKIDTGAAGDTVTMHYQTVTDLGLLEGRETKAARTGGVGGQLPVRTGGLASFRLGGHDFTAIPASFMVEDTGALSDDYVAGNVGGQLLAPFVLVFDYPHARLGFVPR